MTTDERENGYSISSILPERFKLPVDVEIFDNYCSNSTEFKIRIDVETMKHAEHKTEIPTEKEILRLIVANYLQNTPPKTKADREDFLAYVREMKVLITGVAVGSLLIKVKCDSLQILERLWEDYSLGHLGDVVQRCLVTEEILTELSLADLKLKTTISKEEYKACKMHFEKNPTQGKRQVLN